MLKKAAQQQQCRPTRLLPTSRSLPPRSNKLAVGGRRWLGRKASQPNAQTRPAWKQQVASVYNTKPTGQFGRQAKRITAKQTWSQVCCC